MCKKLILLFTALLFMGLATSASGALPIGWKTQDIGAAEATSGASESGGTWTVSGGGHDIWDASDDFRYAYIGLSGDGSMVARVLTNGTGSNNWSKGGVMIRETLDGPSKHASTTVTAGDGNGASFQSRNATGGGSANSDTSVAVAPPHWVKIERQGNTFIGSYSPDGVAWREQARLDITMTTDVYIGLAVSSHVTGEVRTWTFSDVSYTGNIILALKADNPRPADDALNASTWASLQWDAGASAASHDVYFGTDADAVANGTGGTFQKNQTVKYFVVGFSPYPYPDGLVPGTTYYWRIDEIEADGVTKHTGNVWSFTVPPNKAYDPVPVDGGYFVDPENAQLTWSPGYLAMMHTVHFSDDYDTVANGAPGGGEFVPDALYTPTGPLEPETIYYWRVDENNPNTHQLYEGDVWSFKTSPAETGLRGDYYHGMNFETYVLTRTDDQINFQWGDGTPDAAVNIDAFSVIWTGEIEIPYSETYTFYTSTDDGARLYIDGQRIINQWVDQGTTEVSGTIDLTAGRHSIQMEYYENGGGAVAELRWSSPSTPKQIIPAGALSPPIRASAPKPGNGATDVRTRDLELKWNPGQEAVSHNVYFGTDEAAVANATNASPEFKGNQSVGNEVYVPAPGGELTWDTTYYWRVDEVNNLNPDSPWKGTLWSFTTADFMTIEDFEDYNDEPPDRIFETWIDGFGGSTNGSIAGYPYPVFADGEHFCETSIVHGGLQSMPMFYDNNLKYSEVTKTLPTGLRDWTQNGVKALNLWYYGHIQSQGSIVEGPAGTYTLTGAGADIWIVDGVEADEFHYAWKNLGAGTASIITKVEAPTGESMNDWVKAGVMIRETLDPNSAHAFMCLTNAQGVAFQYRPGTAETSVNTQVAAATERPKWLKLTKDIAGTFTAYHANDVGGAPGPWAQVGTYDIQMNTPCYIGLAITSHTRNVTASAVFSNITTTGAVTGATWTNQDIGIQSNAPERMYVMIRDGAGQMATVYNPDLGAANVTAWTQWGQYGQGIALSEFTAVNPSLNLANIDSISLGLGTRGNTTQPGGSGLMFIDDIGLYTPRCVYQLGQPANDWSNNCVVDMPDLEILTDNWLNQPPNMTETVWGGSWAHSDVGTVTPAGSFTIDGSGNFTIAGAGADIWGTVDGFQFASQTLSGDGQITVRINGIDNTNDWAKAGVMIRDTLDPNSAHAMMVITSVNGAAMQYRAAGGGESTNLQATGLQAPICLQLVRQGDTFTGYYSTPNGWVQQGSVEIPMTDPVRIGIAVTSHVDGTLCTATGDRTCPAMVLFTDLNQDGVTDFQDYAELLDTWLDEVLWPQ